MFSLRITTVQKKRFWQIFFFLEMKKKPVKSRKEIFVWGNQLKLSIKKNASSVKIPKHELVLAGM